MLLSFNLKVKICKQLAAKGQIADKMEIIKEFSILRCIAYVKHTGMQMNCQLFEITDPCPVINTIYLIGLCLKGMYPGHLPRAMAAGTSLQLATSHNGPDIVGAIVADFGLPWD